MVGPCDKQEVPGSRPPKEVEGDNRSRSSAGELRCTGTQQILLKCITVSLNTGVTFRDFAASRSRSANAERGAQRQYYSL